MSIRNMIPRCMKTHDHLHLSHHPHNITSRKSFLLTGGDQALYSLHVSSNDDDKEEEEISATAKEIIFPGPPIMWDLIWGSCNGLVLVENINGELLVINPTIKEIKKVPPPPSPPFKYPPEMSEVTFGFGYDSSTHDYKLVSIPEASCGNDHNHMIYSLRNNSWKKLPDYHPILNMQPYCVHVNNQNLNWFTDESTLIALDLANEQFNEIKLPPGLITVNKDNVLFSVGGGKLGILDEGNGLWVMEDYGVADSWTKLCVDGVPKRTSHFYNFIEGSIGINGGGDRSIVLQDRYSDSVFVYSMDEKRCRRLRIEGGPSEFAAILATYFESLESPANLIMHSSGGT